MYIIIIPAAAVVCAFIIAGFRITRPIHMGVIETFGIYTRFIKPGLHWIVPGIQKLHTVRVTEQTLNLDPQVITTNDNMKVIADAHIYIRVRPDEMSVKASLYNAYNCIDQTVDIARTTLRNIIATMPLRRVCGEREQIGDQMCRVLKPVTEYWGVEIVRCQMKEIEIPKDVQEIMQKIVRAENEKVAASDFAAAAEINADGIKRAEIKKAEGAKQARILQAEAEAKAIRLICEAAQQYFVGNAQAYRVVEAAERALKDNAKVVFQDAGLFDMLRQSDASGIIEKIAGNDGEKTEQTE